MVVRRLLSVVVVSAILLLTPALPPWIDDSSVASADEREQRGGTITLGSFVRVVDGQSIDAIIDGRRVAIAISGIDVPQGNTSCGKQAIEALKSATREARSRGGLRLVDDPSVTLDSRGRRVFELEDTAGKSLAEDLVKEGVARPNGNGRLSAALVRESDKARTNRRGCLWTGGRSGELHWPPTDGATTATHDLAPVDPASLEEIVADAAPAAAPAAPAEAPAARAETPSAPASARAAAEEATDASDEATAYGEPDPSPESEIVKATIPSASQISVQAVPAGFQDEAVVSGVGEPTAIAFAPDGRIFIATKPGIVRLVKNGALVATPVIDLRSRVNDYWDRGMLGIALDPAFAANGFIYLAYTYENNAAEYNGPKTSRVVRVTATGDTASPASEVVILGKQAGRSCYDFPAGADCLPNDFFSHGVGALKFGPDGMLYFTHGEGANFNTVHDDALRSQDLNSLAGKLLRVNPATGAGLADNPYWNNDANANRSKVWAYGLRNPYRFNFKPGTNIAYLGDVGWSTWEEINVATSGANFGWPCYEGSGRQPGYDAKAACQTLYGQGAGAVKVPLTAWNHNGGGAAATGGAFYTGTAFPSQYQNAYFYGDYALGFIRQLKTDGNHALTSPPADFGTASSPVDIEMGPDGALYYVAIFTGEIRRIRYGDAAPPPPPPTGTQYLSDMTWTSATNGWGPVEKDKSNGEQAGGDGVTITLNGTTYQKGLGVHASSDVRFSLGGACTRFFADVGIDDEVGSNGSVVFQVFLDGTMAWNSGTMTGTTASKPVGSANGLDISGKQQLQLVVTDGGNGNGYDHADWANARIQCGGAGNAPPVPTIATPAATLKYKVGDTIAFSGSATDPQDGAIAPANLRWEILLHHCPGGVCHTHQVMQQTGIANGSFVAPDEADDNRIEIVLTATDSTGLTASTSVMLLPETVQITLASNPTGAQVVYSGVAGTTPMTQTAVVGSKRTIQAPSPQGTATFQSWSDGGAQSHDITIGATNATYTATFVGGTPPPPTNTTYLSDLTWISASNGWGPVEKNKSNGENGANDGRTITLNGTTYQKGLGVHADSDVRFGIPAGCTRFLSDVGIDDEVAGNGSVVFQVWLDGAMAWDSGTMTGTTATKQVGNSANGIDITGKQQIRLFVSGGADGIGADHADWADARFSCGGSGPPPPGPNTAPDAVIAGPAASLTYKVGDTITFSGSATDTQDGTIPPSGLSWLVRLVHSPGGTSTTQQILQQGGIAGGTFVAPDGANDSRIEIVLTATDSGGLTDTATVTIMPQTVQVTLATNPTGLQVSYAGTTGTAPLTQTAIVGSQRTIGAPSPQGSQTFQSWSDGGAQTHAITVGAANATYTATFTGDTTPPPNTAPQATISAPAATLTYKVGDTITFAGSATDTQDGTIPPAGLSWLVRMVHSPGGTSTTQQILQQGGIAGGTFVAPDGANDSKIEIVLTATDSGGLIDSETVTILPQLTQVTLATTPTGLQVTYAGTTGAAPMTQTAIVGGQRTIAAPSPQGSNTFLSWSDGGAQSHAITVGAAAATYTATFTGDTTPPPTGGTTSYLSDLTWTSATNGWGPVEKDKSNGENGAGDGATITLNGTTYAKGLGVHATSDVRFNLNGTCTQFLADVGVDDEVGTNGSLVFQVWLDGAVAWDSGLMTGATATKPVGSATGLDVTGKQQLRLVVSDGGNGAGYDHGDWANARIVCGTGGPTPPPPPPPPPAGTVYVSSLTPVSATNGWGPYERDMSVGDVGSGDGTMITLNGTAYQKGLGVHADSDIRYTIPSGCTRFISDVGMDDEVGNSGSVTFQVFLDGVVAWSSGTMTGATATKQVGDAATGIDITGKAQLRLLVSGGSDGIGSDHADWADARFACSS